MSKKIGSVTGGGDCPGLNTVIRAVAKRAAKRGWEAIGIVGGYAGLLQPQQIGLLDCHLRRGGGGAPTWF
jgi:ATP-dependent phosphofructokinase / diphosphate-dependent phosphofructokinase